MPLKSSSLRNSSAISFEQIQEGSKVERHYKMTDAVYRALVDNFGDKNPLHTDENYARAKGFSGRVMHGAILNGFISHFIGMEFPGANAIIQSVSVEYKKPNFLNDDLHFEAVVEQKVEAVRTLVLKFNIHNQTQDYLAAKARVQVGWL